MTDPSFWNQFFIWPILNILIALYNGFTVVGIQGSLGFAIIGLTLLVKLVLFPSTVASLRSAQKMQELKPHMDRIREKYKKDRMRQQQEFAKLYREHKINPASGCLPLLIQAPIFFALYNLLLGLLQNGDAAKVVGDINKIAYSPLLHIDRWDPYFLGVNLGSSPSQWQTASFLLLLVPPLTAFLQFLQSKMMIPKTQEALVEKAASDKKTDMSDFSNIMQKQMLYFFPLMIGAISWGLPIGLSLYWNALNVFGIIQQYFYMRSSK